MQDNIHNSIRDTTRALWDDLYLVRFPRLQTTSIEYMKTFGTYITGYKEIDNTLAAEWITSELPISKMVDYYKEGAQVKIVRESDIVKIYNSISDHLETWIHHLRFGVNTGGAPLQDLIAMDLFAHEIYEHAKYHFNTTYMSSYLAESMLKTTGVNPSNFFSNVDMTSLLDDKKDDNKIPEREPLSDYLKKHLAARLK